MIILSGTTEASDVTNCIGIITATVMYNEETANLTCKCAAESYNGKTACDEVYGLHDLVSPPLDVEAEVKLDIVYYASVVVIKVTEGGDELLEGTVCPVNLAYLGCIGCHGEMPVLSENMSIRGKGTLSDE